MSTQTAFNARQIHGVKSSDAKISYDALDAGRFSRSYSGCLPTLKHAVLILCQDNDLSTHAFVSQPMYAPSAAHPQMMPEECLSNTLYLRPEDKEQPWKNVWLMRTPWDNRVQLCPAHVAALKAGTDTALLNAIMEYVDKHCAHVDGNKYVTVVPEDLDPKWFKGPSVHPTDLAQLN
jgi:hypothetical protein